MNIRFFLHAILLTVCFSACQDDKPIALDDFRINQVGYFPQQEKIAAIMGEKYAGKKFHIEEINSRRKVYSGVITEFRQLDFSDKKVSLLDFSLVTEPGCYQIIIPDEGSSENFEIKGKVWEELGKAALKAFYYQRTAIPIEEKYAGQWSRPAAHPDDKVLIHASAVSPARPEGTIISSSKGWYDAGDYNKYIVNSGITVGMLMNLYEDYPEYMKSLQVNIPESESEVPDVLAEVYWNLEWMLTMQDPDDGGVYHKLTTPQFEGFIKPIDCKQPRYVVAKSVTAALDFAASMAQASRIYSNYENDYPGIPEKMLKAAEYAYQWAVKNPEVFYRQDEMNKIYKPEVETGGYGDNNADDEFFRAAVELYLATGNPQYLPVIRKYKSEKFSLPNWGNVNGLAYFTIIRHWELFNKAVPGIALECTEELIAYADEVIKLKDSSPYHSPYGNNPKDFFWGCNSDGASNMGVSLLYAGKLSGDEKYRTAALHIMDYLLGRNATGYCYVTGFGYQSPRFPHHRLSASDGIEDPMPGFLVGGPNPGQQDGCEYSSGIPDESYIDEEASYASNEIAINWQAMFTYFALAMSAEL